MPTNNELEINRSWRVTLPHPLNILPSRAEILNGKGRVMHIPHFSPFALPEREKRALSLREFHGSELAQFVDVLHESLRVRSRREFLLWAQGNLQRFLPHDIMIAAWGNFTCSSTQFDIVTSIPGMDTEQTNNASLAPALKRLFDYWNLHSRAPFQLSMEEGIFADDGGPGRNFRGMKSALVHAIKDARGKQDCLYVLMRESISAPAAGRSMIEVLLPYIDSSLRQLEKAPGSACSVATESESVELEISALSTRELEIMEWVRNGKTNFEIGMILDISVFTVKNHLQRIFRKLNVVNRAQAVSKLGKAIERDGSH